MSFLAVAGQTFTFGVELLQQGDSTALQVNPTLAAADFEISINGAGEGPLDNTPTVNPAGWTQVEIVLSAAETTTAGNGGRIKVRALDSVGDQWQDDAWEVRVVSADIAVIGAAMTLAAGAITAAVIGTDAIDADSLAADAIAEIQSGLGTAANQTTILNRIGAFTGSGVNTILGFLQSIMRSDATLPSDVGGSFTPVLHSLQALRNLFARTSVQGATGVNDLEIIRGDSYDSRDDNPITALGDVTGRTKLWITAKKSKGQTDAEAIFQIEETAGLTIVNGAVYGTPVHGSIVVTDDATGALYFLIDEAVTDDLDPASLAFDIQVLIAGKVTTLRDVKIVITADVTRAIA